jgi:AMMECR1 domain-containing protein
MRPRVPAGIVRFAAVLLLAVAAVAVAMAAASPRLRVPVSRHDVPQLVASAEPDGRGEPHDSAPVAAGRADLLEQLGAAARMDPALERVVLELAMGSLVASVTGEPPPEPHGWIDASGVGTEAAALLKGGRSGVFVTAVMNNRVRACVGSIWANTTSLAREVGHYGALVAARDLRRSPIEKRELSQIELAVSVVGRLERVARGDAWDPAGFGVFVRSGARTGVILPGEALTHAKQLSWALQEAGIGLEEPYEAYRFQTVKFGASLTIRN